MKKTELEIKISTADSSIKIGDSIFKAHEISKILKKFGNADRIMTDTSHQRFERYGTSNSKPYSTMIKVIDYYYIFDTLGIMIYTHNTSEFAKKEPEILSIHFGNKRTFTNTNPLPFSPINSFKGILEINGEIVQSDKKLIPDNINFRTQEFNLFQQSFGTTSIATVIDRVYSKNSVPYIMLFLDNEKDQRLSYMVLN